MRPDVVAMHPVGCVDYDNQMKLYALAGKVGFAVGLARGVADKLGGTPEVK